MSVNNETICAVVVTYNRKHLLLECLEGIKMQTRPVNAIFLVDNASTDGTPKFLLDSGYILEMPPENIMEPWEREFEIKNSESGRLIKLHYLRMPENVGSAGGFHEGLKRAYSKGYDWFWLMDDDGLPEVDCLENLLPSEKKIIAGPLVSEADGQLIWDYSAFFASKWYMKIYDLFNVPYRTIPFNGLLISREVVNKIGLPNSEFFIQCDDVEYSWRALKSGYKLFVCKSAKFYHPKAISKNPNSMNDKVLYYFIRNNIIVVRNYDFFLIRTLKRLVDAFRIYFTLKSRDKRKIVFKAIIDGLVKKLSRN